MTHVSSNQFQLAPDIASRFTGGIQSGQNVAGQFQIGRQREQQIEQGEEAQASKRFVNSALSISSLPDDKKLAALMQNREQIVARGGNPAETDAGIQLAQQGNFEELNSSLKNIVDIGVRQGIIKPAQAQAQGFTLGAGQTRFGPGGEEIASVDPREAPPSQGTASQRDFATFQELQKTDPEKAKSFGRQAGFIRETVQEKADIAIDKAAQKEVAKANIKRRQGFIDTGIEAADSASVVKRSIALLKEIKTGGFDNIAFKARQAFGIEGADEAELSANLGKSVLAQLKPIFGAAFTVGEGKELKRIEASFGKSTAGNVRLLNQTLKIIDRAARRGIAAAEDQGDTFAANEIRSSLQSEIVEPTDLTQLSDDDLLKQLEAARGGK